MESTPQCQSKYAEMGWHRLFYSKDGDFDPSWFMTLAILAMTGVGFMHELWTAKEASKASWGFFGGAFIAVLIAAVPTNKAKIIANAKSIGAITQGITGAQPNMWTDNETGGQSFEQHDRPEAPDGAPQLQQ